MDWRACQGEPDQEVVLFSDNGRSLGTGRNDVLRHRKTLTHGVLTEVVRREQTRIGLAPALHVQLCQLGV